MTIGGPQIPDSPPKKPPTTPTADLHRAPGDAAGNRSRQPASWLAPKAETVTPSSPNRNRSGSATTSCAASAIITTSTRFSSQNRRSDSIAGPIPWRSACDEVRDQHRHDQQRHRHLIGHERPGEAQPDQRQREADHPLGEAAGRQRGGRADRAATP